MSGRGLMPLARWGAWRAASPERVVPEYDAAHAQDIRGHASANPLARRRVDAAYARPVGDRGEGLVAAFPLNAKAPGRMMFEDLGGAEQLGWPHHRDQAASSCPAELRPRWSVSTSNLIR